MTKWFEIILMCSRQLQTSSTAAFHTDMTATVSSSFEPFVVLSVSTLSESFSSSFQETCGRQTNSVSVVESALHHVQDTVNSSLAVEKYSCVFVAPALDLFALLTFTFWSLSLFMLASRTSNTDAPVSSLGSHFYPLVFLCLCSYWTGHWYPEKSAGTIPSKGRKTLCHSIYSKVLGPYTVSDSHSVNILHAYNLLSALNCHFLTCPVIKTLTLCFCWPFSVWSCVFSLQQFC